MIGSKSNRAITISVAQYVLGQDKCRDTAALWEKEAAGCKFQIRESKDWYVYAIVDADYFSVLHFSVWRPKRRYGPMKCKQPAKKYSKCFQPLFQLQMKTE